ncbi:hypothetical protein GCM10011608_46890 [Micromonospora sonchi]|uniref:Uncharacterized protein n=1 Tax=Micromonospora sonchi TaxID=1763543 RepID=A0A917X2D1_9ACTN|nr:hypothetical protein [Micromonospora sonchi]GGM56672.1 hypothetical protein GCM10011608_46890 [Micromonospora sonchi]
MPASRKPKKSRTSPVPNLTPADLAAAAAAAAPPVPVALTSSLAAPADPLAVDPLAVEPTAPARLPASDRSAAPVDRAAAPTAGPPADRGKGFSVGRTQRAGAVRRYAFRRS